LKRKILIIEDDRDIRVAIAELLESEGFDVLEAENGKVGLDLLLQGEVPHLVFLDMMMPVMNGREFLNHILQLPQLSKIPIVVFSAIADVPNTQGAVAFIKKPADIETILTMVEKYAR
jgi:CheY-like chemotaxis protein